MTVPPRPKANFYYSLFHLILGTLLTLGLILNLFGSAFRKWVNSDALYPHTFIQEWLSGTYPIDAWNFGSATFLFPDYLIYGALLLVFGDGGITYPIFAAINGMLLGAACGYAFWKLTSLRATTAFAIGYYTISAILALHYLEHHDFFLYQILLPGFHGSSLILGIFTASALINSCLEKRKLDHSKTGFLLVIGALGLYSNTLLLTQFLVPWLATFAIYTFFIDRDDRVLFWNHTKLICAIVGIVVFVRFIQYAFSFWDHAAIFRHIPYPTAIWKCLLQFATDFKARVLPQLWAFWTIYAILIATAFFGYKNADFGKRNRRMGIISMFVILSVFSGIALPILSLYWNNYYNSRYFLNLAILPIIAIVAIFLNRNLFLSKQAKLTAIPIVIFEMVIILSLFSKTTSHKENFVFDYSEQIAEYDKIVSENEWKLGLCQYWYSHLYNVIGKADAQLNHVREDGSAYFWCNNSYWYFGNGNKTDQSMLEFPDYDFVLMNQLDREAILQKYGQPNRIVNGEFNTFFVYEEENSKLRQTLLPAIASRLERKTLAIAVQ